MAMINCPECGQPVSDQAEKCVHCGCDLKTSHFEEEKRICIECGNELKEGEAFCPKCGCPAGGRTEPVHDMPEYEYEYEEPVKKKSGSMITAIVVIVVIAAIGFFIYTGNQQEAYFTAAEGILEEHNKCVATFNESKELLLSVWRNAITGAYDEKTDKFVYADGYLSDDFNDALKRLYEDEEYIAKLKILSDSNARMKILRKDLKNPPKEYEEYNEAFLKYVDNDIKLNNILIDPNGSLSSISEKLNDLLEEQADLSLEMDTLS